MEVKRASLLPSDELPDVAVDDVLAGLDQPYDLRDACLWVGEALGTVAAARGEELDVAAAEALVRDTALAVVARLRLLGDRPEVTAPDLSVLVEAALIEQGALDVAKALVMRRSHTLPDAPAAGGEPRLQRRYGHVVAWNTRKIEVAIRKAFLSLSLDPEPAVRIAERVSLRARSLGLDPVPIETVQDIVQEELVLCGQMRVAERYILYRAERAMLRAEGRIAPTPAAGTHDELRARIRFAAAGLDLPLDEDELVAELRRSVDDNLTRADLERLTVLNAKSLMERDSDFSFFAGRILLTFVYEETLGWDVLRDGAAGLPAAHRRALRPVLERGVEVGRVDSVLLEYDLDRLADALDPPPTSRSTTSACRRCTTATCSSTRPVPSPAAWRRRSSSGCAWPWACRWRSSRIGRSMRSSSTGCTRSVGSAPRRRRCSTRARRTRSSRAVTSTSSTTRSSRS